ncbi:AAA family ATPase [Streptomyces sp. NPDC050848]|uniref:ATP-binding protein n=1 Tax=Streptomyces sp. NPDC050848 TaxID=3155791 RepID=UPI0033CD03FF
MDGSRRFVTSPLDPIGAPHWVGRSAELGVLHEHLMSLRRGAGGCVLVEGPPGIGKSALVGEAVRTVDADEVLVLRGSADEFCVSLPFQLITEALRPVDGDEPAPEPDSLWGAGARNPLAAGVQEALARVERACAVRPVVLIASDLQWADQASLTVLGSLLRLTEQLPLLLVGEVTTGSQRDHVHQLRRTFTTRDAAHVVVGPLNDEESVLLAEAFLGLPLSAGLRELALQTGGNALHIRELVAALLRERRVEERSGFAHPVPGPDGGTQLPTSLSAAIADRLGYLSDDTLEALRSASALGAGFDPGELAAVLGRPLEQVAKALGEAAESGVLDDRGSTVEFHAPLLRQALYESMTPAVRALRHRQIAQRLSDAGRPPERVAAQLVRAGSDPDDWTLTWLTSSGTALLHRAPQLAVDLLQHATAHLDRADERREPLEAVLAMAAYLRGRFEECETIATRVLGSTAEPDRAGEMTWIIGCVLFHTGRYAEGIELATGAATRWQLSPVWLARLRALHGMLTLGTALGPEQDGSVIPRVTEALELGRDLEDAHTVAYAANTMWTYLFAKKEFDAAAACLDEGLAGAEDDPRLADIRFVLASNKMHHLRGADISDERVWATARAARKAALECGSARVGTVLGMTAGLAYFEGSWDDALADLEVVDDDLADGYTKFTVKGLLALIKVRRGDVDGAREQLDGIGDPDVLLTCARVNSTNYWHARLALADREGRDDDVLVLLRRVLAEEFGAVAADYHRILPRALRLARAAGMADLAAEVVACAGRAADRDDRKVVRAVAWHCQGVAAADPDLLRRALDYFDGAVWAAEAAECADDLAVVLAGTGDMDAARTAMRDAAERYLALGATGDLDRADARWREAGLRRGARGTRTRPATGWESLTPTERRVAELVAEGLSNPDIAERLLSSRRTVQTHVSRILGKLGMRSRLEVARAVVEGAHQSAVS